MKKTLKELLQQANKEFELGHYGRAVNMYSDALAVDPRSVDAHFNLALAYVRKKQYDLAELHARRVLQLSPKELNANLNLGAIRISQGDEASALRYYNKELRLNPESLEANSNIGVIRMRRRQWKEAQKHLEFCWARNHPEPGLDEDLAFVAQKTRNLELEIRIYRKMLKKKPCNARVLNNLGVCYNRKGNRFMAETYFKKALAVAPSNRFAKANLRDTQSILAREKNSKMKRRGTSARPKSKRP